MWRAIDCMSKEVQELIQGDASTDGAKEIERMVVSHNLAEEEPVPIAEPSIPSLP